MNALELLRTTAGLAELAWAAGLGVALLRIRGAAASLLAAILLGGAMLVGCVVVLSLLHAFTVAGAMAATAALTAIVTLTWLARGRPQPVACRPRSRELVAAARREPVVVVTVLIAVAALAFEAFLAVAVAPNEQDALLYHLPRAAYWVQYHTALQFNAGTLGDPEVGNPPNAELMIAWTMLLSHGDRMANLVQWVFAWALMLSIYLGARTIGFPRRGAVFAAALVAILPQPVMQAATAQNDLVAAALIAGGVVFLARGLRDRVWGELAVGAVALGVAVGTKGTVVYALPGIAIFVLGAMVAWRPPVRRLVAGAGLLVAATAALGAFNYVQNLANTGDLTGGMDQEVAADYVRDGPLRDVARVTWNLIDLPGFGDRSWLDSPARALSKPLFGHLAGPYYGAPTSFKVDASEDESAYGPIGWLVFPVLVLVSLLHPRAGWGPRLCGAAASSYLVAVALQLGYGPEEARLLMPGLAFAGPLLALLARRRTLALLTLILALVGLLPTIAFDQNKPLLRSDSPSILARDRLDQQLVDADFAQKLPVLRRLDRLVPTGRLAYLQQDDTLDYLLFGAHFDRFVIPLGDSEVTAHMLRQVRARAIFIWNQREWRRCSGCARGAGLRSVPLGAGAILLVPGRAQASPRAGRGAVGQP